MKDEFPFGKAYLQERTVSFWEDKPHQLVASKLKRRTPRYTICHLGGLPLDTDNKTQAGAKEEVVGPIFSLTKILNAKDPYRIYYWANGPFCAYNSLRETQHTPGAYPRHPQTPK